MEARVTKRTKIRKGDQVVVITGRDNGRRGRVLAVSPATGKIKIEGIARMKRHERPNRMRGTQGGIVDKESFIDISNVQLIDPKTGKPTRVRYEVGGDGKKRRVAASGQTIETK
ncbi:MAG: 50S ribosomal protein L24 [Pyrinomonadaceae bacterium]